MQESTIASRIPANNGGPAVAGDGHKTAGIGKNARRQLWEHAAQLRNIVGRVTPEEFRWQESHYDHDSRRGRELLFLIANHEWVRGTSEAVDIIRSDAVETTIKIDIDLDQITHEEFRKGPGRLWLPVIVLPPQARAGAQQVSGQQRGPEPDPFATVTDAAGHLLAMLPSADVRHQFAAAMAEIIVNMAVARWPGPNERRPTATRDQRLMLSAAIYRLLHRGVARMPGSDATSGAELRAGTAHTLAEVVPAGTPKPREPLSRMDNSRDQLLTLLDSYRQLLDDGAGNTDQTDAAAETIPYGPKSSQPPAPEPESPQFAPELTARAVMVLEALAESVVVAVPIRRDSPPTVLTARIPTRGLDLSHTSWKKPSTWILRPIGHLQIDLLLPSADADRQVQVNLPEGVSLETRAGKDKGAVRPSMIITVERPQPFKDLAVLMTQLDPLQCKRPGPLLQCFADLARAKADAVRETLRQHQVASAAGQSADTVSGSQAATDKARAKLDDLRAQLKRLSTERPIETVALAQLQQKWEAFAGCLTHGLLRRTSTDSPSPRTVVARADMIEDVSQRPSPIDAKVHVMVGVPDAEYFSIARFSGGMSLLLMIVVLAFALSRLVDPSSGSPSREVLAIVLTLFSAVQAGRIERPDRSTLRGRLSGIGNWLIVASILPAVILTVALAFSDSGKWEATWSGICIVLQLLFQRFMRPDGPFAAISRPGRQPRRRSFSTGKPTYSPAEALRSDWWRSTTADALIIGRKAYAYVVPQEEEKGTLPDLTALLKGARQATLHPGEFPVPDLKPKISVDSGTATADGPANVLALLRSGTVGQAATFVVFREKPIPDWAAPAYPRELDLDPDRLAPAESVTSTVDVFLGVGRDRMLTVAAHPLTSILDAAAHRLIVLEAQLPVPSPVADGTDMHWARVRVALRDDEDIKRMAPFLDDIHKRWALARVAREQWVVGVQAVPIGGPRIITWPFREPSESVKEDDLVLASDIDVIAATANGNDSTNACIWRVLAFCTDARSNIENDIMQKLGKIRPQLRLAGVTYAVLHGTAVILLLGQEPQDHNRQGGGLEEAMKDDPSLAKLVILVNEWRTRVQLGQAEGDPLLRVHFRAQDRPGALVDVLESLGKTLEDELHEFTSDDWKVWYAQTQVTGRAALTRLTVRLCTTPNDVESLGAASFEEIERKVRTLAASKAAVMPTPDSHFDDEFDTPEDPVISISLIRLPASAL